MKFSIFCIILTTFLSYSRALSCGECHPATCNTDVSNCKGGYARDICGCCPVCAKVLGEKCGGPWDSEGTCDFGLTCLKEDVDYFDFNADGKCVEEVCDFPKVIAGACPPSCLPTCDNPFPYSCSDHCGTEYCACADGYILRSMSNKTCIKPEECYDECPFPMVFQICPSAQPSCEGLYPDSSYSVCEPDQCVCPPGMTYASGTNRTCVMESDCVDLSGPPVKDIAYIVASAVLILLTFIAVIYILDPCKCKKNVVVRQKTRENLIA